MKKRADSAPPDTSGDCKPSKGLIDELSALEAMIDQRIATEDVEKEADEADSGKESRDDRGE